ncbi:hypothetical protein [Pilibacter termitis]|uniref:hypothetical protein n=1 Tax=Pilibacter termitis TaxID=263852 RepID=UPI0013566774|nr:hypothetical protein [Pilibacter termitis]
MLLRTVARLQHHVARKNKSVMVCFEVCNSEPQHLLAGNVVSSAVVSSCQTSAPCS